MANYEFCWVVPITLPKLPLNLLVGQAVNLDEGQTFLPAVRHLNLDNPNEIIFVWSQTMESSLIVWSAFNHNTSSVAILCLLVLGQAKLKNLGLV